MFDARVQSVVPEIAPSSSLAPESTTATGPGDGSGAAAADAKANAQSAPITLGASATTRTIADERPEPLTESRAAGRADERAVRERERRSARLWSAGYAFAIVLLIVLLAGQTLFHFSAAIAAHWPATAPALARLCDAAGCSVRPLQDAAMQYLAIDASDLQADAAHRGLLTLTATIRNRAAWALAYPHIELTLTDAQDQVVVRRALSPAEYAGGTVDVAQGIAANGEVAVRLFIDASATVQAGYRLYLFYP